MNIANPMPCTRSSVIAVGMSGGVDSSASALLLKEAGYEVFGLYMRNWDDPSCPHVEEYNDVQRVCDLIGIPCYQVNFVQEYWDSVFEEFIQQIKAGKTPNPDILCNSKIKFNAFYNRALALGATHVATGHYAALSLLPEQNGDVALCIPKDTVKDQTYFLQKVSGSTLKNVIFPLQNYTKLEVKTIAKKRNIPTANKKESMGICFIGKKKFPEFISEYIASKKGYFLTLDGTPIGEHNGAHFFTRGQRKGLGIGGEGEAWYVVDKDIKTNTVRVVQGDSHPALFSSALITGPMHRINPNRPLPLRCYARIRHRGDLELCSVQPRKLGAVYSNDSTGSIAATEKSIVMGSATCSWIITFDSKIKSAAVGQYVALYDGNECLGGAEIVEIVS